MIHVQIVGIANTVGEETIILSHGPDLIISHTQFGVGLKPD